jgi:hypothetical protein
MGFCRYEVFSYHFSFSHFSSCYRNVRHLFMFCRII